MATPRILPHHTGEESRIALFVPANEREQEPEFEIGHVLFIDIVGFSKLLLDEQRQCLVRLNEIVRSSRQFLRAEADDKLLRLPTGDGMALVFRSGPEAPAQCAFEIDEAVRQHSRLRLRMGIHSGPVNYVPDVNERANLTGAGINIAQRVMDCGDAGHILISKHVAEDLEHSARWQPHLHDLGENEVKHGLIISLVNLFTEEIGNSSVPSKFAGIKLRDRNSAMKARRRMLAIFALVSLSALLALGWYFTSHRSGPSANIAKTNFALTKIPEKSIAVLPFENLSTNQETAFFTDGVQDEILTDLSKVADLKVTSRTSVMEYRNLARRNLREIGQQLGVAHILEGSVQRIGNHIRVNAQFIDARTDAHLWAQTYDRDLADVFAIQSEIAKAIAEQLQANLSAKERAEIDQKPTTDLTAYDLYLRAMQSSRTRATAIGSGGAEGAKAEIKLLDESISHDPNFVAAYAQLSQTHLYLYWINADEPAAHLQEAERALAAAARLQPNDGGVHLARALLYYWGSRDYGPALRELAEARRIIPNDTRGLFITAMIERRQGEWKNSTHHIEEVYSLDPFNMTVISELVGINYTALRRYQDAAKTIENALVSRPNNFTLNLLRANLGLAWKADLSGLRELVERKFSDANPKDLVNIQIDLAFKERDYRRAQDLLGTSGGTEFDDNGFFTPRQWNQALAARGLGESAAATGFLQVARERAAAFAQTRPEDPKGLIVLAQIDATMDRADDALKEGRRAVALLPMEKDAVNGSQLLTRLAEIYAQVGQADRAFEILERQSAQTYGLTYGSLKLDEAWDPLRKDARFIRLLASMAPKN